MNFKWSQIETLITEAQERSTVTIEFETKRIAELFRYSVYNFRRKKNLNKNLNITIFEEDNKVFVTIYKPVEIYMRKATPQELVTSS